MIVIVTRFFALKPRRLEKLAWQLGRAIVASGEFARRCPDEFAAIGEFALAGFAATRRVFGLEDEAT
jgi:hypothetical protein